ncbi:MAG TPA: division plane positioning ATPase MipZ [Alphaproteobacteria bacterium]
MFVLSFVSANRGVGKTTLATCLARHAQASARVPIALVDLETESPLKQLASANRLGDVRYVPSDPLRLASDLDILRQDGIAFAIVDAPALPTRAIEAAISAADLVVMPVVASKDGLQSVGTTVELAENCARRSVFVINGAGAGKGVNATVAMALVQHGTLAPVAVPRAPAFADVLTADRQGSEGDAPDSVDPIASELWTYLEKHLRAISASGKSASVKSATLAERREFPRWQVAWPVTIVLSGAKMACTLQDVSGGGALIVIEKPPKVGETLDIEVPTLGAFAATVVYSQGNKAGVKFILDAERKWHLAEFLAERISIRRRQARLKSETTREKSVPAQPAVLKPAATEPGQCDIVAPKRPTILPYGAQISMAPANATAGRKPGRGAHVVVVGNEKGGSGKSTVAMHLAVALLRAGHSVATLDLDARQQSLTRYLENRRVFSEAHGAALPMPGNHVAVPECVDSIDLAAVRTRLAEAHDYVVIDTPGGDPGCSRLALTLADTLITPINDSFVDLDGLAVVHPETFDVVRPNHFCEMVAAAREQRARTTGHPFYWIVLRNRLSNIDSRNKRRMAEVLDRLSRQLGFAIGPGLTERVIYRESFLSGLTVLDLREPGAEVRLTMSHVAARREVGALFDCVQLSPHGAPAVALNRAVDVLESA